MLGMQPARAAETNKVHTGHCAQLQNNKPSMAVTLSAVAAGSTRRWP
ncbi:hypothetical protein JOS77_27650 [Chromobacterium haemolyticum]|nr:hypothetical protein JOS77_27650 [Chromobacterium haemolyticum]